MHAIRIYLIFLISRNPHDPDVPKAAVSHILQSGDAGSPTGDVDVSAGGRASLKEMIRLQWETTASPERDAASPAGDAVSPEGDSLASPNFGICDTTLLKGQFIFITVCMGIKNIKTKNEKKHRVRSIPNQYYSTYIREKQLEQLEKHISCTSFSFPTRLITIRIDCS
jgi:hypothetical protein